MIIPVQQHNKYWIICTFQMLDFGVSLLLYGCARVINICNRIGLQQTHYSLYYNIIKPCNAVQ